MARIRYNSETESSNRAQIRYISETDPSSISRQFFERGVVRDLDARVLISRGSCADIRVTIP